MHLCSNILAYVHRDITVLIDGVIKLYMKTATILFAAVTVGILSLCMMGNFSYFCCRLLTFFKINFFKKFFQKYYQCQTVWIQIRTNLLPHLQTTKVAVSKEIIDILALIAFLSVLVL